MKKQNPLKNSQTDWKRVDAMTNKDIDLSEIPEVTPEMFLRVVVRRNLKHLSRKIHNYLKIETQKSEP